MIYTLTGNLLWEQTLEFAGWSPGGSQRATRESFQVGGKGVNVSKMLNRLGAANTALTFAGGATGAASVAWLEEQGFTFRAFAAERATRAGMVVRGGPPAETTFLGPDRPPGAAAVRSCAEFLEAQPDGGVLAVCGSLPGWEGSDFDPLRAALEDWLRRGTLVADTYGQPLAWLAERPLDLVKINRVEFDSWFPHREEAERPGSLLGALRQARERQPVRAWVVTDGPGPVSLIDRDGRAAELAPPPVRQISATGSGDVLLACLLHAQRHLGRSLAEAAAFALPYAAANAAHPGIAEFPDPN